MTSFTKNSIKRLFVVFTALVCSSVAVFGQETIAAVTSPTPFIQDIRVQNTTTVSPTPSATPLVQPIGSSRTVSTTVNSSFPVLKEVAVPGYTGILVETLDGKIVMENLSSLNYNPASNVKTATSYAVLKTFGPDFRFPTSVWTDGQFDQASGTLYGNIYVTGKDPTFNLEHGVSISQELNRMGIRTITGDLVVTDQFIMNYSTVPQRAAATLQATLDGTKRTAAINKAWQTYLVNSGKLSQNQGFPHVAITGGVYVQQIPSNARVLFTHESAPMKEIVKAMMCYSNNYLSERLGDMLGGAFAVARVVHQNVRVAPNEFYLATSSGLGMNRVSARAMMLLLREFRKDLEKYKMTFADVMPVAGMDRGTLAARFDEGFARGSVIGKTGTLANTDGGASALSGEMNTRSQGKVLFVIFNMKGSVPRFRAFQNSLVPLIQSQLGGALPINYTAVSLDTRLATTRIVYPNTVTRQRVAN
jgi:D-alanyl-D-alanine carboxypeptidase/D-alanyl-D-alanine-endopeptidase (penicillin-binding protein 4)